MSRRIAAVVIALVAALTLSSCGGSTADRNMVAKVDDATLTQDELSALVSDPFVKAVVGTPAPTDGTIELQAANNITTIWIWLQAEAAQGKVNLDDETAAADSFAKLDADAKTQYDATTGEVRSFMTRLGAANALLGDSSLTVDQMKDAARQSDVTVDSRYGFWNQATAGVIRFGVVPEASTTVAA